MKCTQKVVSGEGFGRKGKVGEGFVRKGKVGEGFGRKGKVGEFGRVSHSSKEVR
jgi:hypothetical protein